MRKQFLLLIADVNDVNIDAGFGFTRCHISCRLLPFLCWLYGQPSWFDLAEGIADDTGVPIFGKAKVACTRV